MKKVPVEKYNTLKGGDLVEVETLGFKFDEKIKKLVYGPISREKATLIRCLNKTKEVIQETASGRVGTGDFETVGDIIVYRPLGAKSYSVIGCGMFRVWKD